MNIRDTATIIIAFAFTAVAHARGDCRQWTEIDVPNPPESINTWLTDVDALSEDDAWAVGYFKVELMPFTTEHYTYILHWDGSTWEHIPSPSPGLDYDGGTQCYLTAVKAIAPDDVWAVGHFKTQQSHGHVGPQPLTLHWDGSSWEIVPAPFSQGESSGAILNDIDAISSDDIWAGGIWPSPAGYGFPAFMLHWDGSDWTVHETPDAAYSEQIRGVKAIASDNVWAVGGSGNSWATSYVIHWDGDSWRQVDAPSPYFWNFLHDIDAVAPDDIWIAGQKWDVDISYSPFMLHWDGSDWTEVESPGGGQSIVALASDNVWSADVWTTGGSLAHFDGNEWTVQATVGGPPQSTLLGLAGIGECDVWGVGRQPGGHDFLPLAQRLEPVLTGDVTGDGEVNVQDLLALLAAWGPCEAGRPCHADFDGDGFVSFNDLIQLLSAWS